MARILPQCSAGMPLSAALAERLFCTVGVHPTRCGEFDSHPGGPDAYLQELSEVLQQGQAQGKVVAIGECGLGEQERRIPSCWQHAVTSLP